MVKESNYEIIKFVNGEVELEVTISLMKKLFGWIKNK